MKNLSASAQSFVITAVLVLVAVDQVRGAPLEGRREFRPVVASAVRVDVQDMLPVAAAANPLMTAWAAFDRKEWLSASEWFLSALSADPQNEAAAEGLVMSLYHNADYYSAGLLAAELGRVMPRIPRVLGGVVAADVRGLVQISRIAEAKTLLGFFPESEPAFEASHRYVKEYEGLAVSMVEGN
jgi:hypothetical protein